MIRKKLLGGLLTKGIKSAARSKYFKKFAKDTKKETKKLYSKRDPRIPKEYGSDKKFLQGLMGLDIKRAKAMELGEMMTYGKKRAARIGARGNVKEFRESRKRIRKYLTGLGSKAKAFMDKKIKKPKMNSKGGIQIVANKLKKASKAHAAQAKTLEKIAKKSTGGLADYYKDIL